jgi:predicted DNA-binding transcriptional regulator AlpA
LSRDEFTRRLAWIWFFVGRVVREIPDPRGVVMHAIAELSALVSTGAYELAYIPALPKISQRQVWRLSDSGVFPVCIRILRSVRWSTGAIDLWIEAGRGKPKR